MDYNFDTAVIVKEVELCRFLRDTNNPEFAKKHPGLKQLVASQDKVRKEVTRELGNKKQC